MLDLNELKQELLEIDPKDHEKANKLLMKFIAYIQDGIINLEEGITGLKTKLQSLEAANKSLQEENEKLELKFINCARKTDSEMSDLGRAIFLLKQKLAIAEEALDKAIKILEKFDEHTEFKKLHPFCVNSFKEALEKIREGK